MEDLKINILGSIWDISFKTEATDPKLEKVSGYADPSIRSIVVYDFPRKIDDPLSMAGLSVYQNKILRHELIHAFLYESGFDGESNGAEHWAENEEMIDWIALQLPKIVEACRELRCLN